MSTFSSTPSGGIRQDNAPCPSRPERGAAIVFTLILCFAISAVYVSRTRYLQTSAPLHASEHAPLYLPHAKYVRLVTLGYDTFFSKVLWFNTINYFGKQFAGSHDYRWLGDMCDLVTVLDPKANHAVEFCGTLLAWVAKEPAKAVAILSRGIENDSSRWRYFYLRGFAYWYFLERLDLAKDDFLAATNIPGAPSFLASMASRLVAENNGPTLARQFLEEMVANTPDPAAQKALKSKLKRAKLAERIYIIELALESYRKSEGSEPPDLNALVERGYLTALPEDPYKGTFFMKDGKVQTTSNKRGLGFTGKTAKTGMFKEEFRDLPQ